MLISGFHIDGFGIYHNQGVQDLPRGLVLFTGENECGKTTLMEFIRTVLFGFPRKDTRNLYPPLKGGNHGGRLQVVMQDGQRFTIERLGRHATIGAQGGALEQTKPGDRLLGGLDRKTFEHVFAIGLKELQGLEVLSQEGVSGRLFSASAGLGATSVPGALKALDKELGNLLTQRGQQRINQMVHRLKEIDPQIKKLRGLAAAYAGGQKRREELEEEIRKNQGQEEDLRRQLRRLEQLEQARGPWVNWGLAREKAEKLAFARSFPPNGLERLENLKKDLDQLRRNQQAGEEETAGLKLALDRLTADEALLAHQEAIEALLGEREKLATAAQDYPTVKSGMEQAKEEFRRRLRDLGKDWDPVRLAQVDTSVQVRQRVQELGRRLGAAERQFETAQANQRTLKDAVAEAQRRAHEAEGQFHELPAPPVLEARVLQQQQEAVRQMRSLLHRRDLLTSQLSAQVLAQQDSAARLTSLKWQMEAGVAPWPGWPGLAALAAGLALAAVLAYQRSYLAAGLVLLAGAGLGAFSHLSRRRQAEAEKRRSAQLQEEEQQVQQAQEALALEAGTLEEQMRGIDQEIDRWAHDAGLPRPQDLTYLELMAQQQEQAAEQWREWTTREGEKNKAAAECRAAEERLEKATKEVEQASQELAGLKDEWEKWLAARGFSDPVRPEGFEAVLQAVESARGAQGHLEGERRRVEQLESYLSEARTRIRQVLEACGRTPLSGEVGGDDLEALRRGLAANLGILQEQKELAGRLAATRSRLSHLEGQKNDKEGELQQLLQKAGAADEEGFRLLAQSYEEWRECLREEEADGKTLLHIAGTLEAQAALAAELSRTDPLQLQAEKEGLEARLRLLTDSISHDHQEIGSLKNTLAHMEEDDELGRLLFEERSTSERLTEAAKRWATLVVCRHLLEQARGVYERERQPQVIQEAGRLLNTMAQARYRLVASVGEDSIQLEDASLKRKEEICWSAGLADQVYLAIRLGLAREFGRHTEPLPVILDDVLVKFDPTRRLSAARVILDFSRSQQVLLFSCHPEFREIFEEIRRDPQHHEALVVYFTIADGVISSAPFH